MTGVASRLALSASVTLAIGFAGVAQGNDDCRLWNSQKTTVTEIATHQQDFVGRCVAVDGVMSGPHLYENVDGVYLSPDSLDPSSNGAQLGLDNLGRHFSDRYQAVSIVGRVQDCEQLRQCAEASAGPNEFVMVTGYCHYYNGAALWIKSLRRREGEPFERQMGSAGRPGYGDLAPAPEDWPHRAKVDAFADDFLNALHAADNDALLKLHFRNVGLNWSDDEAALIRFLENRKSPFSDIRRRSQPPQRQILVDRSNLESNDERDADNYSATICFCRTEDCTGRWPIASFDADNLPSRPYACTTVQPYLVDRHDNIEVAHFETEIGTSGLAEPKP